MDTMSPQPRSWKRKIFWAVSLFLFLIFVLGAISLVLGFLSFRKSAKNRLATSPQNVHSAVEEFTTNPTRLTAPSSAKQAYVPIATDDDPSLGPRDAKVVIVEFGDLGCPFSKKAFPAIRELMTQYQDRVRFIYRDYPIDSVHPTARKAAEAGGCAHEQGKFWALHDKMFQNQEQLTVDDLKRYARETGLNGQQFDQCLDSGKYAAEVEEDYKAGAALGVEGTPTWFINGEKIQGALPYDFLKELVEYVLTQTK